MSAQLHKDQLVFFVYLLGIDSNGHRFNPISKETRANIELVDAGKDFIFILFELFHLSTPHKISVKLVIFFFKSRVDDLSIL